MGFSIGMGGNRMSKPSGHGGTAAIDEAVFSIKITSKPPKTASKTE